MSEFEAYNKKTRQWKIFPLSRYRQISKNKAYYVPPVNPDVI